MLSKHVAGAAGANVSCCSLSAASERMECGTGVWECVQAEGTVLDNRMCSSSSSSSIKRRVAGIVVPKTRINIYDSLLLVFLVVSCLGGIYPLPFPLTRLPGAATASGVSHKDVLNFASSHTFSLPLSLSLSPSAPMPSHILVQVSCNWYVSLVPSSEFFGVVVRLCDISRILMVRPVLHVKLVFINPYPERQETVPWGGMCN